MHQQRYSSVLLLIMLLYKVFLLAHMSSSSVFHWTPLGTDEVRDQASIRRVASHKQSRLTHSTRPDYMSSWDLPILVNVILYELLSSLSKCAFYLFKELLCCCYCLVTKSCPTLCDPIDSSLADRGSSVHGISQARLLAWVAISFSRGSFQPRDRTHISCISRQFLYH